MVLNESQLDPPIVPITHQYLHDRIISSLDSADVSKYDNHMVTSEDQSSYDVNYSNGFTYRHEYHYNNSEIYDESIIDDPCDSSTYEIAKEFYNDLECFIMDNDNDSIAEQASGVVEFEFLCQNLLHHNSNHENISVKDHLHISKSPSMMKTVL